MNCRPASRRRELAAGRSHLEDVMSRRGGGPLPLPTSGAAAAVHHRRQRRKERRRPEVPHRVVEIAAADAPHVVLVGVHPRRLRLRRALVARPLFAGVVGGGGGDILRVEEAAAAPPRAAHRVAVARLVEVRLRRRGKKKTSQRSPPVRRRRGESNRDEKGGLPCGSGRRGGRGRPWRGPTGGGGFR
uniref:Uncharacterized protein n=1 Tax=Leersia perrieri TaxID=77586 RepID=A0A0D9WVM7_9ORYZ